MSRRLHAALLPIAMAAIVAGCGLPTQQATAPRTPGGAAALSLGGNDETDLTAGARRRQVPAAVVLREGKAGADGLVVFPTIKVQPIGRLHPLSASKAGGPVMTGVLRYPDFQGNLIPAANVTVHLETKGGVLGGQKKVATALTDAGGRWTAELPPDTLGKAVTGTYELGNKKWTISKYRWAGPTVEAVGATTDTGERTIEPGTNNGKAALIHQVWNRAIAAFEREGIDTTTWWTRPIDTVWPGSGNFYSSGTVTLTDADWWDVNGHEIGHAIFFAGFNSAGGGGPHKIDECYGADLAWSEGFASFFSAVISIDRADQDAKFQFMVPRRAPIRVENVPEDVCGGPTNEWRVSSAMWDLYDTNADGKDQAALPFKAIWGSLVRTNNTPRMQSVLDAFRLIAGKQPAEMRPGLAAAFGQSGVPIAFQLAR
jgi:hypothetical protein